MPNYGQGKICYLVIPSTNLAESMAFYKSVFHWSVRTREDGSTSFDDGVGEVSGTWVIGRPIGLRDVGVMVHIMVDDAVQTCASIVEHGGEIVQPIGADAPEITAHFSDPSGNILGIYQHRG